ncbi:ABC transporter ATP-binding protein [Clostridium oryzae]|uniref:Putative ABC transporter ATP-binding protein n=1 Tax=Clostridium oryzae TaxID=1450648 RepID=A0A1V4IXT9_9CLOT|nr:ABC transporter ATP-binding protein [Clostridium oryzae]OPJ64878.1 putative ABC transporter ATP-binding protein [Clostridium oryzae]
MSKRIDDKKETIKRVLKYIKPYWLYVAGSLLFAAISVTLTLYILSLIGDAIDCMVGVGKVDFAGLIHILKLMVTVIAAIGIFQWLMNMCNNKIVYNVIKDMRKDAFKKIQILPLKYIDQHSYGEIVSRVIADVDQLADGLLMGFTQLFSGVITIIGTLIFMFYESAAIAVVVVCLTPLSLFVASFIARRTYKMFQSQSEIRGEQTAFIDEMIGNQKVVQAFGHEKEAVNTFEEINNRLEKSSLYAIFFSSITNPATRFINGLVYTGVGITGAIAVINGSLTVGVLAAFLNYANQYTKPFNEISGVVTELQNALACAKRILELIDEEPQNPDLQNAKELAAVSGEVTLDNVEFSYTSDKKLIEKLNLTAKPGQKIAIVGPTGCGKTTIINLLMRFYETDGGKIRVDGNDIKEVTRKSLRTNYGMVLQDTWLKSGTVRDNIRMGKPDAADEEIVAAAKAARAHNFIKRMQRGYDTEITENGEGLSQGEKQLLCIARVMLSLPPMLILDEATSSIDTRTEIKIQEAFMMMMKGRTSFIIAHRLSTIQDADIILVMRDGHIIEQGKHEALLEKHGFYYELYNSQFVREII